MTYQYNSFQPTKEDLNEFRKELYHSQGKGYIIFKNFIPQNYVEHLLEFWDDTVKPDEFGRQAFVTKNVEIGNGMVSNRNIYYRCPNYYWFGGGGKEGKIFYNFFWNSPHDYLTHTLFFTIQILRNLIETKPVYNEIFPHLGHTQRSAMNLIIFTRKAEIFSPPHRDWHEDPYLATERLQATLFLTKKGVDYSGRAFVLRNNQGKETEMDSSELEINPGDLVLWRYNNEHAIYDVKTEGNQRGFVRMILPPEYVFENAEPLPLSRRIKIFIGGSFIGRVFILPPYKVLKFGLSLTKRIILKMKKIIKNEN